MTEHATREEIERLRTEIQFLRRHPQTSADAQQKALIESMERLHGILEKLVTVFETANKEIYAEYDKGMHEESAKIDKLLEQNEKIARGMVALADMVKQTQTKPASAPVPSTPVPAGPAKPAFPPEESFVHQPVQPMPASPTHVPPLPSLPPLPPMPSSLPTPATLAPPPPPRRSILDKFSFK